MIKKEEGLVNEIVYKYTAIDNGKIRNYLTLGGLKVLINSIIKSNATTHYIRIIPYYNNIKHRVYTEMEEFMFFIECADKVSEKEKRERMGEYFLVPYDERKDKSNIDSDYPTKSYEELTAEEIRIAKIMRPLVPKKNPKKFIESLNNYWKYLIDEQIALIAKTVSSTFGIKGEDLIYGYISFEVHSG